MYVLESIKKKCINFGLTKGLFVGCLVGALITFIGAFTMIDSFVKGALIASVIAVLIITVLWTLIYSNKYKKVESRVLELEKDNTPIDNERLQLVGRNLSLGENYLVYHNKLDYEFFNRRSINKVRKLNGKSIEVSDVKGNRKVLKVDTSRNVDEIIDNWVNAVKEIDSWSNNDSIISEEGGINI